MGVKAVLSTRKSSGLGSLILTLVAACIAGCAAGEPVALPDLTERTAPADPFYNWPGRPDEIERRLTEQDFDARQVVDAGGGVTGAQKATLYFPSDDMELKVKWKVVPPSLDGWNNSPRKELAAYEIQKWFLEPEEYVVPTTVVHCRPMAKIRDPRLKPTVEGTNCVLFVLSAWLENVTVPDQLYDEERFRTDANYAYHLANFNVLAVLIDHRDGREGNFLVSKDEADRRVYAIDNGISFSSWIWNYFVTNWEDILVPAIPKTTVDRLRQLTDADYEKLGVVVEMRLDENGIFRQVPSGPNLSPRRGARRGEGIIQFGLTQFEIDEVRDNVEDLIEDVDEGELAVF
jgi:hypothetical protein